MRRGHGSTKVPGVKLRPAAPSKSNKPGESTTLTRLHSSIQDDVDSTEVLKNCKKPLVGVVICGSGLSDKVNLYQQAVQLGAQTSSDLTDRVTHLVCENSGSPKYNYCVEHGLPILQPSWISDIYEKWTGGENIDVEKMTAIHRFPTFRSVKLCITAIGDVDRRKQIRRQLEKNGGTFVETCGKGVELTHLLCGPDREEGTNQIGLTAKMQYALKHNEAKPKKVYLVWEDWFWDCLEFKGILNEKEYLATASRPPRRIRREPSPLQFPITSTAEQSKQHPSTTSQLDARGDVEETANVKRMPEAAALLWENALKKRGFEMKDGKLTRSPSKSRLSSVLSADDSEPEPSASSRKLDDGSASKMRSSLNAAFKRTKSFATKSTEAELTKSASAFQRVRSTPATAFNLQISAVASDPPVQQQNQIPEGERNLFSGLRFRALGEANGPSLTEALVLRGGIIVGDVNAEVDFIIVRLVSGNRFYTSEHSPTERQKFRTECWVEQCIFEERILAADDHPAFTPLQIPTPFPGAEQLVVHMSGLTPQEKTPSVRLLKAIGATVTDQLSRRNTHLVCPCGSGPKFIKALEWKIPVLTLQWLFDTVKSGKVQDASGYLVIPDAPSESAKSVPGAPMMMDITNSEFVQGSSKNRSPASAKGSDKSQSSSASSFEDTRHTEPMPSEDWTANALLSESAPENPPTSSPPVTSPSNPSPVRRHATVIESTLPKRPSVSPFTSPTKKSKSMIMERVPSSATPSPMRMPSNNTRTGQQESLGSAGAISPSPAPATASTSTLSGESANVLKDAIASLLGKRTSSDDNSSTRNAEDDSQDKAPQHQGLTTRVSKRSKPPPRTKSRQNVDAGSGSGSTRSFSRTTSLEVLGRTSSLLSGAGTTFPFDFTLSSEHIAESPTDIHLLNQHGSHFRVGDDAAIGEETMRVTYEDPSQRAEERRLLSLISGNGSGEGGDAMDADTSIDGQVKDESQEGEKKPQPKPRRRGRNLVRRVKTNPADQE